MFALCLLCVLVQAISGESTTEEIQYLNELPLDKLLRLKSSLQDLVTADYGNVSVTTPTYFQSFGAQAMAIKAPPIKRTDYEEGLYKKESKISNIFSMSVTTLAFLAFGGYLLCLIVQAVKAKQNYNTGFQVPQPTTFFVSSGLKKKPSPQFASYGRRKRDIRIDNTIREIELPPEKLFDALVQLCEGYANWSKQNDDIAVF
ncbi:uncharacterized protein LOC115442044 [Manduca sexta]|uniref:uncharacterized protein LOC115442044 n=1 Tax=Manduca sexta TaxID=7130 RepID=UPI00188F8336|nr:uncharacterized protein LOC115442044 [Manduca sexta]